VTYDILIPHYGTGRLTALAIRCLETIREYSADYRLVFIDNGSPEFDAIAPELWRHPHVLIRNLENQGFVKAINRGLQFVMGDPNGGRFIVFLNNDTEAVSGWLDALSAPLLRGASISGPRTTATNSWQGRTPAADASTPPYESLHRKAMLAFFCTMFRRDVFGMPGLEQLDEDFGAGLGDDDMFCWKAQRRGLRLALVRGLVIPHHHRSTFAEVYGAEAISEMQERGLAKFFEKTGQSRLPARGQ
jgi:hypothetical protein